MIDETKLYGGTVTLQFDDAKHLYTVDGMAVPGVTTILGVISKPALVPWAAKLTASTFRELITAELARGIPDAARLAAIEKEAKGAPAAKRDAGASIGTQVHAWAEAWARGNPAPYPEEAAARRGVDAFSAWVEEHHVRFIRTEQRVYSRQHRYAGTFDFLAEVDGRLVLGDYKVSSGIYPEHHLQTAGYAEAWREATGEQVHDRLVVCFDKTTGKFTSDRREGVEAFLSDGDGFLAARRLYQSLQVLS